LEADGNSAGGGLIMVFTDGEETQPPNIEDVADDVLEREPIVHGLLMDGVADDHDLIKLAVESGGDFCIYEDSGSGGIDYYQCMMDIVDNVGFAAVEVCIKTRYLLQKWNRERDTRIYTQRSFD